MNRAKTIRKASGHDSWCTGLLFGVFSRRYPLSVRSADGKDGPAPVSWLADQHPILAFPHLGHEASRFVTRVQWRPAWPARDRSSPLTVAAPRGICTHFAWSPGRSGACGAASASVVPASIARVAPFCCVFSKIECLRRVRKGESDRVRQRLQRLGLDAIAERLEAGMRLGFEDGVRLFACPDLLALGWLANRERERRHGARTYYNFNIRIEATNVCVASCLFCSFARLKPGDPGLLHDVARAGLGQAAQPRRPAAHRDPRRQRAAPRPAVRLLHGDAARLQAHPAVDPPEVLHRRRDCVLRRPLRHDRRAGAARAAGRRPRLAARRRRRDLRRRASGARSRTTSATPIATSRSTSSRTASGCAPTSRCSTATSRPPRSASTTCCAPARCRTRPAASRRSSRWRSIPTTTRCASCRRPARPRRCACSPCRA